MILDFDLSNKNILIFGSEGLIGKKICEIIKKDGNIIRADIKKINSKDYFLINAENYRKLLITKKKNTKKI